jgi:hypothetical protein
LQQLALSRVTGVGAQPIIPQHHGGGRTIPNAETNAKILQKRSITSSIFAGRWGHKGIFWHAHARTEASARFPATNIGLSMTT